MVGFPIYDWFSGQSGARHPDSGSTIGQSEAFLRRNRFLRQAAKGAIGIAIPGIPVRQSESIALSGHYMLYAPFAAELTYRNLGTVQNRLTIPACR